MGPNRKDVATAWLSGTLEPVHIHRLGMISMNPDKYEVFNGWICS